MRIIIRKQILKGNKKFKKEFIFYSGAHIFC